MGEIQNVLLCANLRPNLRPICGKLATHLQLTQHSLAQEFWSSSLSQPGLLRRHHTQATEILVPLASRYPKSRDFVWSDGIQCFPGCRQKFSDLSHIIREWIVLFCELSIYNPVCNVSNGSSCFSIHISPRSTLYFSFFFVAFCHILGNNTYEQRNLFRVATR